MEAVGCTDLALHALLYGGRLKWRLRCRRRERLAALLRAAFSLRFSPGDSCSSGSMCRLAAAFEQR